MTKQIITLDDVRRFSWGKFKDVGLQHIYNRVTSARKKSIDEPFCAVVAAGGLYQLTGEIMRGYEPPSQMILLTEAEFRKVSERDTFQKKWLPVLTPHRTFDESLGDVRAAFDGRPDSERWTLLLEAIDQCVMKDLEQLLAYIEPQLDKWSAGMSGPWEPPRRHPLTRFVVETWKKGLPDDELRVAPPSWIIEMAHGKYSPKHRLVRALNLERLKINWGVMKAIMNNPHLRGLTHLNIGDNAVAGSKTFYKTIRTHEMMRTVKNLTLYGIVTTFDESIELLNQPEHSFDALERVRYMYNWAPVANVQKAMKTYPCFSGATFVCKQTSASTYEYIS